MISFFLISLRKGIPIFYIIIKILISSKEWFFSIDAYDLHNFNPLIGDISFLISLDNC